MPSSCHARYARFIYAAAVLANQQRSEPPDAGKLSVVLGSVLGWIMTCSYVGSRIPQLIKNYRRGMTTGLSLPMFVLLVLGSTTYVASIFVRSACHSFDLSSCVISGCDCVCICGCVCD